MKRLKKMMTPLYLITSLVLIISCSNNQSQTLDIESQLNQLFEQSDLDNNALFVYDLEDNVINFEIKDGWETGWEIADTSARFTEELCRGGGISFARCVRNVLDGGSCVTVYKDGGDYVAIKATCPITPN